MKWWPRKKGETNEKRTVMSDADRAITEARTMNRRVDDLARSVHPGLNTLEAHRRDNHILDAMLDTIVRRA